MMYKLKFLPIANNDIHSAAMYIADELKSPIAAANLIREVRSKVHKLRETPYIYREYHGEPQNEYLYRVMPVKNYLVFYMVDEASNTVEIHRFLYAKMDLSLLL